MKLSATVLALLAILEFSALTLAQDVDWKGDLDFLNKELRKRHPNPFSVITEKEFNDSVDQLAAKIDSLDSDEATFELMELVVKIGDGHTSVVPNFGSFRFFPINVKWFEDGVYVSAIERKHKHLVGAKLIAVGDMLTEKVVEQFGEFVAHDNFWGVRKQIDKQFQTVEFLDRVGALDDEGTATFHFEKDSEQFSLVMKAVNPEDARAIRFINAYGAGLMKESIFLSLLIKDEQGMPFWNEWIPEEKLVYFKYNQCRDPKGFRKLVDGTAKFIAENDVEKFVLDLRDNSGGSSLVFKPLLTYLRENKGLNQKGKLFVIVGRNTYSSGIFAACDMRQTNAIFVGEPTSSKPNHFGEVKTFQLPNSGLTVQHSTKTFQLMSDIDPDTFTPDVMIGFTAERTFAAQDQALQAIFDCKD